MRQPEWDHSIRSTTSSYYTDGCAQSSLWVVKAVGWAAADAAENPALKAAHEAAFHAVIIGSRFL